jgi:hypothetical protein
MSTAYREALDAAVREYETALADRARLEKRLGELQQTIGSLCRLCGLEPTVPFGLTEACRLILRSASRPVTAVEVRDRLATMGFDLSRYANVMATVHTVLRRMREAGEAEAVDLDDTARVGFELVDRSLLNRPHASKRGPGATPAGKRGRRAR